MPESDNQNSSWNRHEPQPFGAEEPGFADIDEPECEDLRDSELDSQEFNNASQEFDFSLKFEDYAPVWMQKVKALYDTDPAWTLASTFGAIAIILTITLLFAMPNHQPLDAAAELEDPVILGNLPDPNPIDSRVEFLPDDSLLLVELETDPLYVSFGNLQNPFSGIASREEKPTPLKLPDFNFPTESPSLVLNVQKMRILEREILDPNIDAQFLVEAKPDAREMQSQLDPADRFLFDRNWKLFDLARADLETPQVIRPTLYHERFPDGNSGRQHLQVGQERPFDRSQLDHLTRATAPQQEANLNLEIRKQFPKSKSVNHLLTYSILVKNEGTSSAFDVSVEETLSPLASLVDFSPRGEVIENHLYWKIAQLAPNEEREFQVKVFLDQTGNVKTNSNIKLASNVTASTEISALNLDVQIKGPETVSEGDIFAMDFVITNQGTRTQKEVSLDLDLPEGLEHQQGRRLTLNIDELQSNQSRTFHARVKATKKGAVTSQATLIAQGLSLGEAALEQNVVARKIERKPTPAKQAAPSTPTQACPCQPAPPVAYPVFYFVP